MGRIDIGPEALAIGDLGPGIFEPFDRAGNANASACGIGPNIVKRPCDRSAYRDFQRGATGRQIQIEIRATPGIG